MDIALATTTQGPFDEAVARTRNALGEQGFGVLTEIDIRSTLDAKLGGGAGDELGEYLILGACNPQFAQQALRAFPRIGVLLPCNVVLRAPRDGDGVVVVEAMNPSLMAEVTDEPALVDVAAEVGRRLQAALDSL
ncbi:DUF302 domain-containing protein [Mycolicibacterium alvei]|jgi:uncharacterized protein (DUF302 family)|uniref:ABC transporter n=1 Tax=Mycolicibacterium alvei TaxID=67081 RepID=A0A6N4URB3_9MYCO|nr:DUF302 domain-containing protein [Mycolicibacterium alvei]MCV7001624.1 DUF302 domain-containing protein [Mycolicibacterium alvei]BBX26071.1 ABC transporter [Mycolicibacterium alvei]